MVYGSIGSISGEGLYFFLGYFAEYFSRFPEEGKDQAINRLMGLMENDPKSYLRMGAFQALLGFADDERVIQKLNEVASRETDQNLKNYYNYFLETLN
ncbi:hypothetical protein [Algoriphagus boritolerans]|uniref:hypothetical protein n=1 Tax=Algoriphagus boritolerans TaxID=308111 RepID=UPI000A9910EF